MEALCLFSGGTKSTVALAWAVSVYPRVATLAFNYPSRPALERPAAREIAARYYVKHIEVDVSFMEIFSEVDNPREERGSSSAIRRLVFDAVALSIAKQIGAIARVAGYAEPDGSRLSIAGIELQLPLLGKSGSEILRMGQSLLAPLEFSARV